MNSNKHTELDSLTARLAREDKSYTRLSKGFKTAYWVLTLVYLVLLIIHLFDNPSSFEIISSTCFCLSMLSFALIFERLYANFNTIDYSLPTLEMLKKAKKRYAPLGGVGALIVPPILLSNIGLSATLSESDMSMTTFQLFFFAFLLLAILMGLLFWKVRYKPLYDNISLLIKQINQ